jgi:hypothetical protein
MRLKGKLIAFIYIIGSFPYLTYLFSLYAGVLQGKSKRKQLAVTQRVALYQWSILLHPS